MKIIIVEVPLSKNKYVNLHWTKRARYKDRVGWLIKAEVANRKRPRYKKASVTFGIYFKTKRRRDVQNYLGGGLIAWLDILADIRVINDDCYDCIGQPIVTFNIDKDSPRTEIIIRGK